MAIGYVSTFLKLDLFYLFADHQKNISNTKTQILPIKFVNLLAYMASKSFTHHHLLFLDNKKEI